jgi:hypothetical protein
MAHGSGKEPELPANAAEREEWGKQGKALVIAIVRQMHLEEAMADLKLDDDFTNRAPVPSTARFCPE